MLPDKILQSDLLDLLFENRNKTYGAYALRKSYNKTIASAIGITAFIALLFSILQLASHIRQHEFVTQFIIPPDQEFVKIDPVKPQPKNPVPQHAATHSRQEISSPPVIVNDNEKTQMPTVDILNKSMIGETKITGDDANGDIQPPVNAEQGPGAGASQPVETKADETHLSWAQEMPEYPGGINALKKFMLKNLRQPDDLAPGEKVVVKAFFVVNKDGKIEQVKIISGGRNDLDKEVERVIGKMPLWKPGRQNGSTVAVYFNLPVTFVNTEEE
ncbi:MAG TPA: energy transducer TonB [Parafilimonas sp.]|nr:energy transducer TonB [Parafilimonas sp.]